MWILECDGDVLKHKRIWLRPGKTYLFGRTKPETGRYQTGFQINHKTVSRKHLILKVATVEPDDVGILAKRTAVVFEDAGTKLGTKIDETKIAAASKFTSIYDVHVFKLGGYEYSFKLVWKPVVFSYTFSSKQFKGGKDPLIPIRARLAELDVKALPNYASGKTTHVITTKRNTSRGLQALIQGGRIVTEEFVGALQVAATTTDLAEAESFAPLETDFDAGWPDETSFLPAPGKEPGPKEAEIYDPRQERKDVFGGMTFIFFDSGQYDNLQPAITDGGGKAVQAPFEAGVTTVQDAHKFVKEAAGERDSGELSGDNLVVCVKFGSPLGHEVWTDAFIKNLCLANGFRMADQTQFLEAILTKSIEKLFKRLEADGQMPNLGSKSSNTTQPGPRPASPPKPPRRALRGPVKSVFTGFDNGSDDEVFAPPPASSTQQNGTQANGPVKGESEVGNAEGGNTHTQANGRKRHVPGSDDEDEQALRAHQAHMFRGTEAMKRRRLETAQPDTGSTSSGLDTRSTSELVATDDMPAKKKKGETKNELDLKAALRAQREAEEAKEQERLDRNREDDEKDGLTIEQMKNLAVIEECEVRTAPRPRPDCNGDEHGPGWNPDWNGRKNFKKFRKQGTAEARRGQRVIIPLEEAKATTTGPVSLSYSVGATNSRAGRARQQVESSDEEDTEPSRRSASARTPRSRPSQPQGSSDDEEDPQGAGNSHNDEEGVPETVPSNLQTGSEPEAIDVDAPRTTRAHGPATQPQVTATQQSSTMRGAKRKQAATQSFAGAKSAPKRQKKLDVGLPRKLTRAEVASESESEDDLKFKFRRKTRT